MKSVIVNLRPKYVLPLIIMNHALIKVKCSKKKKKCICARKMISQKTKSYNSMFHNITSAICQSTRVRTLYDAKLRSTLTMTLQNMCKIKQFFWCKILHEKVVVVKKKISSRLELFQKYQLSISADNIASRFFLITVFVSFFRTIFIEFSIFSTTDFQRFCEL